MNYKLIPSLFMAIAATFIFHACNQQPPEPAQGEWIRGSEAEKTAMIEGQLRGFDMAMVETDYRYSELYWAGKDENWNYAVYQAEKIQVAIENGLQRRPLRAPSAENFMTIALPAMQAAAESGGRQLFDESFQALTKQCNMCHALEDVAFFTVKSPMERRSSIRF
jgi:hypothetical protein